MGFLDKIFKKREEPVKEQTVSFKELEEMISGAREARMEKASEFMYPKFSEIKHLIKEIGKEIEEIKKRDLEGEEGHKKLRKIVQTSKNNLVGQLINITKKLEPPNGDFEEAVDYSKNSAVKLEKDIANLWKSIAITKALMKDEMKRVGEILQEVNKIQIELKEKIEEAEIERMEDANELILNYKEFKKEIAENEKRKEDLLGEVKNLEEWEKEKKELLAEMEKSELAKELKNMINEKELIEKETNQLKNRFVDILGEVDKPLKRFIKMAESKKIILKNEEEELLNFYIEKPLSAIKKDPKGTELKKILGEVKKGIINGEIQLKEKEKEKKVEALEKISKMDFFEDFFWKMNQLKVREKEIEKSISENKVMIDISRAKEELESIEKELEEKGNALECFKSRIEKDKDKTAVQKKSIEDKAGNILNKNITLSKVV